MAKKRNPQDTTLRNNRARAKETKKLRADVNMLGRAILGLSKRITAIEKAMGRT